MVRDYIHEVKVGNTTDFNLLYIISKYEDIEN